MSKVQTFTCFGTKSKITLEEDEQITTIYGWMYSQCMYGTIIASFMQLTNNNRTDGPFGTKEYSSNMTPFALPTGGYKG